MAEAIAFNIAATVIESLGKEAIKQIGKLWGVTDEFEKLKNTLSTIQAVLLDAEEKQWAVNNPEVTDWLEKLKDVVYDVDDLLDGFSTDCLLRDMTTSDKMPKKVRNLLSKSKHIFHNLKMGHKIKAITQKLDAITNDHKRFQAEGRLGEIGVRPRKRDGTHSFVLEAEAIGRDDAKKEIIDILLSDSNVRQNVGILPITGLGGLGKTTLAQLIFNDLKIDKHFQLKMWVCVSDNFDVRKVIEKVLESATKKEPECGEMDTLVDGLRKEIGGKKYLLVLDDVWNEDVGEWNELKTLLMNGASGSRILVTTRSAKVAKITQTIEPYSLQGLDSQVSWCLFKKVAFENGEEPVNSRKVEVGKKIVEKCLGVPLVIITIGRLLYLEDSEAEWDSFEKNRMTKIKENDILPTLKLSYDQLPSHLKQCFAYCSIFPKDYEMEKSRLIELWIAQGFIKLSNENECLEDVGHEYFMDLLWRSFFQENRKEIYPGKEITRYKMHDLMHDLAMSEAGLLITILESAEKSISEKTRHVSVALNIDFSFVIPTSSSKPSGIRTLLSLDEIQFWKQLSATSCEAIFSSLKFLRVLDLQGIQFDLVQSSICKLKYLRDLNLSRNLKIKKLPDSINRLQNLYTLRLYKCTGLKELPRGITKLVNLRHLYIDECYNLACMPRGLGELKNLQTLSTFVVDFDSDREDSGQLTELNRMNSLRGKLSISGLRSGGEDVALDCKGANLKEKEHLQTLYLYWGTRANISNARDELILEGLEPHPNLKTLYIDHYWGERVPMWLLSLTNLIDLKLEGCRKLKYLPPLSRLPFLKSICLERLEEIEYISDCSDNNEVSSSSSSASVFFPSLEEITLGYCGNLKGWWRRSDSDKVDVNTADHERSFETPLMTLIVDHCPMLTSLPMFPHLQEWLCLRGSSWKPMQQTFTNAFSSAPLSKLKKIRLSFIEDLETLTEDGLQNLISLQCLDIWYCPKLKSLSQGVQDLPALHHLSIISCPELELDNDEQCMQWKGLKSLISLEFRTIPKLVSLPLGLQHVTTLRQLDISNCSSLMALPEWICNWASLEQFTMFECPGLTSLPEAMSRLTSLKMLKIHNCPILLRRCEQERGEDWLKIAHIPERNFYPSPPYDIID